tara:strand:- start:869 stop:1567 length:699 start_codon:yes stop_codon:yes gene_type:complete
MMLNDPAEIQELKKSPKFFKSQEPKKFPNYFIHNVLDIRIDGLWLEFGVWVGSSAKIMARLMPRHVEALFLAGLPIANWDDTQYYYGFDSFEGLPEDWLDPETGEVQSEGTKGYFNLNGRVPDPPLPNIKFIKGWFDQTLPEFAERYNYPIAFLHVDCDLYSSTKTIFDNLHSQIVPGTVIMFDEIYNYSGYQAHEFKAFKEFVDEHDVTYEWIAHVADGRQACLKITGKGK